MYNLEFFYISLTRDSRYATIVLFDHKMDPSYNKNVDNYLQSIGEQIKNILMWNGRIIVLRTRYSNGCVVCCLRLDIYDKEED
jgi:hypothetical protein